MVADETTRSEGWITFDVEVNEGEVSIKENSVIKHSAVLEVLRPLFAGTTGVSTFGKKAYFDFFNVETSTYSEDVASKEYTVSPGAVGGIINVKDTINSIANTSWYHYDMIGNVVNRSNNSGDVADTYSQDAYGNVLSGTEAGYHLTTKEYFPDIDLYYFNARWYEPRIGRFVAKDPIEHINRYWYCGNRPLSMVDVDGMNANPNNPNMSWDEAADYCLTHSRCSSNGTSSGGIPSGNCCDYVQCVMAESGKNPLENSGDGIPLNPLVYPPLYPIVNVLMGGWPGGAGILCQAGTPGQCAACRGAEPGGGWKAGHIAVTKSNGQVCQCTQDRSSPSNKRVTCDEPFGGTTGIPPDWFFPLY